MIENLILIILSLLTGVVVKYVDNIEDVKKKKPKSLRLGLGTLYGILMFLTVYFYPFMAPLWVGTVLGLLIYGKIDALSHYVGVIVFFFLLLVIVGFQLASIWLLLLFILVNLCEEYLNKLFDDKKIKNKILAKIFSVRPLLEITTFIVSLVTGIWMMWFGLLFFDLGYTLIERFTK